MEIGIWRSGKVYPYVEKGHNGPHCHAGLLVLSDYSNVNGATCSMFDATNAPTAFCVDCAAALVKQDLSKGFTRF